MDFECRGWPPQPQIFSSSSTKTTKKCKISNFSIVCRLSSKFKIHSKVVSQMVRLCDYGTVLFSYLHIGFLTFLALLKNTFCDGTPCRNGGKKSPKIPDFFGGIFLDGPSYYVLYVGTYIISYETAKYRHFDFTVLWCLYCVRLIR